MKSIGVTLGRFAPLHKGHQKLIDKMIEDFGVENSLVMIGSSNSYNERTPYTFFERKEMVKKLYSTIKIIGVPDVNPDKDLFEPKTLKKWVNNVKSLEKKLNAKIVFYGGGPQDINYLEKDFEVKIAINRKSGKSISASKIRRLISREKTKDLKKYIDPTIISLAIDGWKEFVNYAKK